MAVAHLAASRNERGPYHSPSSPSGGQCSIIPRFLAFLFFSLDTMIIGNLSEAMLKTIACWFTDARPKLAHNPHTISSLGVLNGLADSIDTPIYAESWLIHLGELFPGPLNHRLDLVLPYLKEHAYHYPRTILRTYVSIPLYAAELNFSWIRIQWPSAHRVDISIWLFAPSNR